VERLVKRGEQSLAEHGIANAVIAGRAELIPSPLVHTTLSPCSHRLLPCPQRLFSCSHRFCSQDFQAAEVESREVFKMKIKKLLTDKYIMVTLLALFCANGAISCLEATFGNYMEDQFGFSVQQIGMLYVIGAVPSVIGSKIAGGLGNKYGRWKVVMAGMIVQGSFYALGPKTSFAVEVISLVMLGLGMGLVDGCAPALLAQRSEMSHGGTGIVYTLNTMAVQCGFIFGPLVGSAIMEHYGFAVMSAILGGFMVLVSPTMLVNKDMPMPGEQKGVKELAKDESKL